MLIIFQQIYIERRMKGDLIETYKIINGIPNYGGHFFQYFSPNWKFTVNTNFKY